MNDETKEILGFVKIIAVMTYLTRPAAKDDVASSFVFTHMLDKFNPSHELIKYAFAEARAHHMPFWFN